MDENGLSNMLFTISGVAVLWRIVWYQGAQILKLTERQDKMWQKCFGDLLDDDTEKL